MKQTWRALARVLKASDCMHTEGDQVSFDVEGGAKRAQSCKCYCSFTDRFENKKRAFLQIKSRTQDMVCGFFNNLDRFF